MGAAPLVSSSQERLVDLREANPSDLAPLLEEEATCWRQIYDWDFHGSAEMVQRFVSLRALSGFILLVGDTVAGYAYYVFEEHKGLIGDVYVQGRYRSQERENALLEPIVRVLAKEQGVRRIESQLMMLSSPLERRMPYPDRLSTFRRCFMMRHLPGSPLARTPAADRILLESWREERQEEAARLIATAYRGHVDGLINDQYQTLSGCRRFLLNIVQYPGCGRFFQPASYMAFRSDTGEPCGLVLASLVAPGVGHITQLCVSEDMRGRGAGYELLRRALESLAAHGCNRVSLTVTHSNARAVSLYERMGFYNHREFAAHIWEGF